MRSIRFEAFSRSAPNALEDVCLAAALLAGAASKAEAALARPTGPTRAELAAAGALQKIIRGCNSIEAALADRDGPPVRTLSPDVLATIATVEAARAAMPSADTLKTIATVEAAHHAVSRQLKG
jgi:hypothetical protein